MEIKVEILKNFEIDKLSPKLLRLGKRTVKRWINTYKELTNDESERFFTSRTGNLLNTVKTYFVDRGSSGYLIVPPVPVKTKDGETEEIPYGYFLEVGTKTYIIKPKEKKFLRFPAKNGKGHDGKGHIFMREVKHPGIKPRRWFIEQGRIERTNEYVTEKFKEDLEKIQKGEI